MVDRRSSINYMNSKYGRGNLGYAAPATTIVAGVAPSTVVTEKRTLTTVDTPAITHVDDHQLQTKEIRTRGGLCEGGRVCGCPWWLCLLLTLLGILLLGVLIGFLSGIFGKRAPTTPEVGPNTSERQTETNVETSTEGRGQVSGGTPEQGCNPGFFAHDGKCIKCPEGSNWNGQNCVRNAGNQNLRQ